MELITLAPTQQPTTNPISNITSIEFYKCLNQITYYSSHLINNTHSNLQKIISSLNMYLNHLLIPCKPPTCSNTTYRHKFNYEHHQYKVLQVFKSNKILFITSNKKFSFTFARDEKHSQYILKPPYNTMHAICLFQHNNSPQN